MPAWSAQRLHAGADARAQLIRVVEGKRGAVPMRLELVIRFDYGSLVPWVRRSDDGSDAIGGAERPAALHAG